MNINYNSLIKLLLRPQNKLTDYIKIVHARQIFWRKNKIPYCKDEPPQESHVENFVYEKECEPCCFDKWKPKIPKLQSSWDNVQKQKTPKKTETCYPGMSAPLTSEVKLAGGKCSGTAYPSMHCFKSVKSQHDEFIKHIKDLEVPIPDWNHKGSLEN